MALRQDASTGQVIDDHKPLEVAQKAGPASVAVKIYSPYKVYYDDVAFSLSAVNSTGPFDILPGHHNFITLLVACEVQLDSPRGVQKVAISGGLLRVKADQITLFLNV